jgi:hypothetical protein
LGRAAGLIINADDWGCDRETTDRTFKCLLHGSVSSVSAMVFMEDSERAAEIAYERGLDVGLHLNFTTSFSSKSCPAPLLEHQCRVAACLLRHSFAPAMFHPTVMRSFDYVVAAQLYEFQFLYGTEPRRLDGHHQFHLCANVLLGDLLPPETIVRRNVSFEPGEKHFLSRFYRSAVDRRLARRHGLTDFFFALVPLQPARLKRIFSLARQFVVEVKAHPANPEEYAFLAGDELFRCAPGLLTGPLSRGRA